MNLVANLVADDSLGDVFVELGRAGGGERGARGTSVARIFEQLQRSIRIADPIAVLGRHRGGFDPAGPGRRGDRRERLAGRRAVFGAVAAGGEGERYRRSGCEKSDTAKTRHRTDSFAEEGEAKPRAGGEEAR
jgi:hypothetical protein